MLRWVPNQGWDRELVAQMSKWNFGKNVKMEFCTNVKMEVWHKYQNGILAQMSKRNFGTNVKMEFWQKCEN